MSASAPRARRGRGGLRPRSRRPSTRGKTRGGSREGGGGGERGGGGGAGGARGELGFRVGRLGGRVTSRTQRVLPRTHMLVQVETDNAAWLADVGFGAAGPLRPLAFAPYVTQAQYLWQYRLVEQDGLWRLQIGEGGWAELYQFTLQEQALADYEMSSYYVSTHPESRFVQGLIAHRLAPERRLILIGNELTEDRGAQVDGRRLNDPASLAALLVDDIGLPAADVAELIDTLAARGLA